MLSGILTIAGLAALLFGAAKLILHFLPYMVEWFNFGFGQIYEYFDFLPVWLLPFAFVAIILACVGWGVKLL